MSSASGEGAVYMMGAEHHFGRAVIMKSTDSGESWSKPGKEMRSLLQMAIWWTLRVNGPLGRIAAMVRVSADGRSAQFDPTSDFIDFPGGAKKFTIHYDAKSKLYWSLANYVLPADRNLSPGSVRNSLALIASPDLIDWTVRSVLLHHPHTKRHAFQYVDWEFDGADVIAASRTAFDEGLGGAHNAHDANFLTFHRFNGFRELSSDADQKR